MHRRGGRWYWSQEHGSWCVQLPGGAIAFPFTKVRKLVRDGLAGGESIVSFYHVAVNYIATGKLRSGNQKGD